MYLHYNTLNNFREYYILYNKTGIRLKKKLLKGE